jgi:alpha-tubulin suppressor-like RCC1 family protein
MALVAHQPRAWAAGNELRAWGANGNGQLGVGTNIGPETCILSESCSTSPVAISGLSQVTMAAAGDFHTLALTSAGTVQAWGFNGSGQLGSSTPLESASPLTVAGLTGVLAVAAGHEFSVALLSNGTVMAWGENNFGQLGNGSHTSTSTPTQVTGLTGVTAITAGGNHVLALLGNGTIMAWGAGSDGQLGNGQSVGSAIPVAVNTITTATALAAGENHSLARLKNGKVMAWGENAKGQLGNNRTANAAEPVTVSGLTSATAIAAGGYHSLALLSTGSVVAWGENSQGELGNNTTLNELTPVAVSSLSGVTSVAAGGFHSLAVTSSGAAYAWGYGGDGQLGTGNTETSLVPIAVPGLGAVAGIDGGRDDTVAFEPSAPVVTSLSPSNGPPAGATAITITGANLGEAKQVNFGGVPAKSFTVVSQTTVNAVSPAGSGTVDVTVTTNEGTSPVGPKDHFSYVTVQAPTVTGISPTQGPAGGGTEVKITGTNLAEASQVRFGTVAAGKFTVLSATSATAVSPAGAGTVDIRVTAPGGTSEAVAADHFTYTVSGALATVTKISPSKGPSTGATTVTINGTNLASVTAVSFGALPATSFKIVSATKLRAVAPPGSSGAAEVRLTNPAGLSEPSAKGVFRYGSPTVTSVSPSNGPKAGGSAVTVTGSGFALGSNTVFAFGKFTALAVNCTSSAICTMTTAPSTKAEKVDVRATSAGLASTRAPALDAFTYE